MKRSEVLARTLRATKLGVRYKLGAGGMKAMSDTPADASGRCDCSGFTAWALGMARVSKDPFFLRAAGGWMNTDSIVADARDPRGLFTLVTVARPGDLIVFGKGRGRSYGHVGVVTQVKDGKPTHVVHCSPANESGGKGAIAETAPTVFVKYGAIIARYNGLED